jgi:hypothetical protein
MWLTLVAVTLVGMVLVAGVAALTSLSGASVCGEAPDPAAVAHAQRSLAVLAGIAFTPWLLAAVWIRPRLRVLLAGVVMSAPAWLSWRYGYFDPQVYLLTWCF